MTRPLATPIRIEVRNKDLARMGMIDDFTRFDATLTFNAVGRWQIEVPPTSLMLPHLATPGSGILLINEDTGEVVFSGPTQEIVESYEAEDSGFLVKGRDDNGWLADRLALPEPLREVYAEAVLLDQPTAWWRLNDPLVGTTPATVLDSSGNGRHMATNGANPTSGVPGVLQTERTTAFSFPGPLVYTFTNGTAFDFANGTSITLECWAKFTDLAANRALIIKGTGAPTLQYNYQFWVSSGGALAFAYSSAAGVGQHTYATGGGIVAAGRWYHLALTYTFGTAASAHLYVNGVEIPGSWVGGTGAASPDVLTGVSVYLGTRAGGDMTHAGEMDEVALYRTILSANRIRVHYTAAFYQESYVGAVIVDKPSRYYRLGEAVLPSTFDYSGNVQSGTFSATGLTLGIAGPLLDGNYATRFDGVSGWVSAPVLASLPQFTIECWARFDGPQGYACLVTDAYVGGWINFALVATGLDVHFGIYEPGFWRQTAATTVTDGVWTHLAGTYDGVTLKLYKNGVLVQTFAWAGTPVSGGSHIRIGRRWDSTGSSADWFKGEIDEVAIYPTPLEAGRIARHYIAKDAGYDVRSGTVEAVMRSFIDVNAGQSAIAVRRIPGFTLGTYHAMGATITEQARYGNLLDLLRLLAVKGEDGANMIRNPGVELDVLGYGGLAADIVRVMHTAYHGTASLRVTTTNVAYSGVYFIGRSWGQYPMSVTPSVEYTAGLYAKLGLAGSKSMVLTIEWYTAGDALISNSNTVVTLDSTDWQQFSVTATAPGTAAYASVTFLTNNLAQGIFDFYTDTWRLAVGSKYQDPTPLGFDLRQELTSNQLVFNVYEPRDLSTEVVYSPALQNLLAYEQTTLAPKANAVYLGGGGVLTGRVVVVATDDASVAAWGRREVFKDRRDSIDVALLTRSAVQELVYQGGKPTIDLDPLPTSGLLYGVDYGLGDRVSVVTKDGVIVEQVVYEVEIELGEGAIFRPRVGPAASLDPTSGGAVIEAIDSRINRLEAV